MVNHKRYIGIRKKLLKQKQKLVYERTKISSGIRQITSELNGWDRALIDEE